MPQTTIIIALAASLVATGAGLLMPRFQDPAKPFLISPIYVQITGLIISLVFAAELVSQILGVSWTPFNR